MTPAEKQLADNLRHSIEHEPTRWKVTGASRNEMRRDDGLTLRFYSIMIYGSNPFFSLEKGCFFRNAADKLDDAARQFGVHQAIKAVRL